MPASKILLTIESDTKREEQTILTGFLERLQYSPTSVTEREQPDFEFYLNNKLIGVEITKYYSDYTKKGSATQQKISEWLAFAKKFKKKLLAINSDLDYLYGAIHFRDTHVNYSELLRENSLNEFQNLVESSELKKTEQTTVEVSMKKYPILGKYVDSVFLWNTYPENIYLWWDSSLQSGSMIHNESALKFIVNKKSKSAKRYEQAYFQKWLIIYASGIGLHDLFPTNPDLSRQGTVSLRSISVSESEPINIEKESNYFTHILVWDKFTETIFQIYPYEKKIFDYGEGKIWVNHLPIR